MTTNSAATTSIKLLDAPTSENYPRTRAAFYQAAVDTHLPVALWRNPLGQTQHALVDFNDVAQPTKIDFTEHTPGFAFAPFINEGGEATLFLKAGLYLDAAGHHFCDHRSAFDNPFATANRHRFLTRYQQLFHSHYPVGLRWVTTQQQPHLCTQAEYCTLVETAIAYIQQTGIKKIVTSRATETPLPLNFSPMATFAALCQRYPHAFVSLVSIPTIGTWLGASPEVLLSLSDQEIYTVALAGTQPRPSDRPLSAVSWGTKEIEEQALVSDYIRDFFQQLQLNPVTEIGPQTVSAGQIVHLQTQFRVRLDQPRLSQLANQILHQLHPTSAVCGMPKPEALSFILEKENYDRAFYCGFLGPVHLNNQSHLFVNLRCMQLKQDKAILYVGGGITPDSIPQAEWTETVLKSKTLLNVLHPN